jgi:hypothetical protein
MVHGDSRFLVDLLWKTRFSARVDEEREGHKTVAPVSNRAVTNRVEVSLWHDPRRTWRDEDRATISPIGGGRDLTM